MLETIITVVHVVLAIILVAVVLLQSGKSAGLSGSIGGGAETFFGKNKAKTLDGMLEKLTAVLALLFIITSLVLALVVKSLFKMYKQVPKKAFSLIVLGIAFVAAAFTNINIILVIIACALLGIVYSLLIAGRVKK